MVETFVISLACSFPISELELPMIPVEVVTVTGMLQNGPHFMLYFFHER